MIPDAKLQIDVNLSEDNVAFVKVGDPVESHSMHCRIKI